jgi:hypothetical protein
MVVHGPIQVVSAEPSDRYAKGCAYLYDRYSIQVRTNTGNRDFESYAARVNQTKDSDDEKIGW